MDNATVKDRTVKILGLSFDYHDSSAALVVDGEIIAAAQEERFSRIKHDAAFPSRSIQFCLNYGNINGHELDAVVHYENPFLKFSRVLKTISNIPTTFEKILSHWLNKGKFEVSARIIAELGIRKDKIHFLNHHQSHAAAAYYCSPFNRATVITLDGAGEFETITISKGENCKLEKIYSAQLPNSLGLLYSAFTAFLGFKVNEGEYKVMGMSAFGQPSFYHDIKSLVKFDVNGDFSISQKYFDFFGSEKVPYTANIEEVFGKPRRLESEFDMGDINAEPLNELQKESRHYADIAASLQKVTEELILSIVGFAVKKTGIENVCLSGGVALNSLANGKTQQLVKGNLYVHPAAGDSGSALGAALCQHHMQTSRRIKPLSNSYLGEEYSDEDIMSALAKEKISFYRHFKSSDALFDFIAEKINNGSVVGWMQGRFEWGPRALGARSILANPSLKDMQSIVNQKIKFREPFRPFAPSVLEEKAKDYFNISLPKFHQSPEYFMLSVVDVRKDKKNIIPAVTHVDGTARIQLVRKSVNKRYYNLIESFEKLSGIPMLLNTSFNLKGEPMVASPMDALKTFYWCDMDFLVINNFVISKEAIS